MIGTSNLATVRRTWWAALTDRTFIARYLQMLVAMAVGTVALGPLSMHLVHHAGAEVEALLMASTMVIGMAAWTVLRGDRPSGIVGSAGATYASFVVLFPFLWLGALTPSGLMVLGHVLMVPAMAVAMSRRR
jgi:flagellar biosynthetic protein FliP